jgi:hypothetical protein
MAPARRAVALSFAALYLGAPVSAELVQAYLPITGKPFDLAFFVLFLAPLYGGAAVLVRETAVRLGMGWPGILLLAAAFGVVQAALVDMSMFLGVDTGVPEFDDAWARTAVAGVGLGSAGLWVLGHVVMSVGTPLALVDGLMGGGMPRPWLGRRALTVVAALFVAVAVLVHLDTRSTTGRVATVPQLLGALTVAGLLVWLATTRAGAPVPRRADAVAPAPALLLVGAAAAKLATDLCPPSWLGVGLALAVVAVAAVAVRRWSRAPGWGRTEAAALAAGALLAWCLVGFLAPAVPGVDPGARYVHNTVALALAASIAVATLRRPRRAAVEPNT